MSANLHETHAHLGKVVYHKYVEYVGDNAENESGKSDKFWEVCVFEGRHGRGVMVRRWGKFGTNGQTNEKSFPSSYRARSKASDIYHQKRDKGYTKEVDIITRLGTLVGED